MFNILQKKFVKFDFLQKGLCVFAYTTNLMY